MKYHYVTYWRAVEKKRFRLCGVIGAAPGEVDAYFPEPELAAEWREVRRKWQKVHDPLAPLEWLRELAGSGNGFTEEYDEVREIEAPSLMAALRNAYNLTLQECGGPVIDAYTEIPGTIEELRDPLAGMFPERPPGNPL